MKKRLNIEELEPDAYKALFPVEKYTSNAKINPILSELIRIRASQLNDCAYFIQIHTNTARKLEVLEQKLCALSFWKESPLFSQEERVVLSMTGEVTLISQNGLSDKTYEIAKTLFDNTMIAIFIMLISIINIWNRIAISSKLSH